jgi:translation initiation factor 3 subunit B
LYDFKGTQLREDHIEKFKQLSWRPRPPTFLSKEEQKNVKKNLREYSKVFDEDDFNKKNQANRAVIDSRRRLLEEWRAWRVQMIEQLQEDAIEEKGVPAEADDEDAETIEEIVEEIIDETEEIID